MRSVVAALAVIAIHLGAGAQAHAVPRAGRSSSEARRSSTAARSARKPDKGQGKTKRRSLPPIVMEHLTTGEVFTMQPDSDGHFGKKSMKALRRELRCHHTGKQHAISSRLVELVYGAAHHFGDARVLVVAGYRAPRVARAKGNARSHHREGIACDFKLDGVGIASLRDWLRTSYAGRGVGVGYYPNAGFVHLDVNRGKDGFWIDYSAPGASAQYSPDADGDLRTGRADLPRQPNIPTLDDDDVPPPHAEPFWPMSVEATVDDPGL